MKEYSIMELFINGRGVYTSTASPFVFYGHYLQQQGVVNLEPPDNVVFYRYVKMRCTVIQPRTWNPDMKSHIHELFWLAGFSLINGNRRPMFQCLRLIFNIQVCFHFVCLGLLLIRWCGFEIRFPGQKIYSNSLQQHSSPPMQDIS